MTKPVITCNRSDRSHWPVGISAIVQWSFSVSLGISLILPIRAQEPAEFFRQNCFSCHTIGGGRVTGPDLKDVESRKDREWLLTFIRDPQSVINGGDPYAAKLLSDARGVIMPRLPAMNRDLAISLLDLIAEESLLEESQFLGLQISDQPFTAQQIERGQSLFQGLPHLENGGPACLSCHAVTGVGALGGGRLGPDLTRVYERLGGRQAVASWLLAPATESMRPLFADKPLTQDEILPLVAFLENSARTLQAEDSVAATMNFLLLGLGGTVLSLAAFGTFWKDRFRSVRRELLESNLKRRDQ